MDLKEVNMNVAVEVDMIEAKENIAKTAQERYSHHQLLNKARELAKIMELRHSNRIFSQDEIKEEQIIELANSIKYTPSSCDRRAVRLKLITDRDDKALLGGLLVGGVGFIHRAPAIFLLFAELDAYKAGEPSGSEQQFMPQIDAGIIINQLYLKATAMKLHCIYVNPQVRRRNISYFYEQFSPEGWSNPRFLGAFCFGNPPTKQFLVEKEYNYDWEVIVK